MGLMIESDSVVVREVPGGARRADTFLLVVGTIVLLGGAVGFRHTNPPVISLFFAAAWLQIVARWIRHVWPQYVRAVEYLAALALGAALYAAAAR
jgi:hypothetical protein